MLDLPHWIPIRAPHLPGCLTLGGMPGRIVLRLQGI
jgi:hypothetical protein